MKTLIQIGLMVAILLFSVDVNAQTKAQAEKQIAKAAKAEQKKAKKAAKKGNTVVAETAPAPAPAVSDAAVGDSVPVTTISFTQETFNFGQAKEGEMIKHDYVFTNTGKNPLIIENVKPSCGCTAIDWTKDPIPPGGTGKIKAQFDTNGKAGQQMKYITVVYNGDPKITRVTLQGEVIPKVAPASGQ